MIQGSAAPSSASMPDAPKEAWGSNCSPCLKRLVGKILVELASG